MMQPTEPRVLIRGTVKQPKITSTDDGLTIEGYMTVFNQVIRTWDQWTGEYDEKIAPGAFTKSLQERYPVMLFNHGRDPVSGGLPIGRWDELTEDRRGLFGRGLLADNDTVRPIRDAISMGGLTGMSFMAEPLVDEIEQRDGDVPLVTRQELRLMEGGPVTFPAYESTTVTVRSLWLPDTAEFATPAGAGAVVESAEPLDDTQPPVDTLRELARVLGRRYLGQETAS